MVNTAGALPYEHLIGKARSMTLDEVVANVTQLKKFKAEKENYLNRKKLEHVCLCLCVCVCVCVCGGSEGKGDGERVTVRGEGYSLNRIPPRSP